MNRTLLTTSITSCTDQKSTFFSSAMFDNFGAKIVTIQEKYFGMKKSCVFGLTSRKAVSAQLFQASATVCHCSTRFKVEIQLDHFCIGDGSYIDVHKFIWA